MILDGVSIPLEAVRVLGARVLITTLDKEDVGTATESGIILPQSAAEFHGTLLQGRVVAVGDGVPPLEVVPGMRVIASRWGRTPLDKDGNYWVARFADVQAIIEEDA